MTPLIFSSYIRNHIEFTSDPGCRKLAERLTEEFAQRLDPAQPDLAVFMGRIGQGRDAATRSIRHPLEKLLLST